MKWLVLLVLAGCADRPCTWEPPGDPRPKLWGCIDTFNPDAPYTCATPAPKG